MMQSDRIENYLQRLTPLARSNLLTELERLEVCGNEIPGSTPVLEKLRAEFRKSEQPLKNGQAPKRVANPSRYFFTPLEALLVNGTPEHANSGWILRGSLAPIWEWITRDLLPTMARDYNNEMKALIAADKQQEARRVAATFQIKVIKCLESTLATSASVDQTRIKLATYTASHAVYIDLTKILSVLRARDALATFSATLPAAIEKFDAARVSRVTDLLDEFAGRHAAEIPFALALVARRLKPFWQLIHLATKVAPGKNAADVATTPYAITVSMVLDRLEDNRSALRGALKSERVMVAKDILAEIRDTESALRARIDLDEDSDWGMRLRNLMSGIEAMVEAEVSRFPDNVGHVLRARTPRSPQTLAGRLTSLWR